MFVFSLVLIALNNPILIGFYLVFLSLISAIRLSLVFNSWFRFIVLLVFTGGIIIITLYVRSLATWGSWSAPVKPFLFLGGFLIIFFLVQFRPQFREFISIGHLFYTTNFHLIIFTLLYLLFGLFVIVFLVRKRLGALRILLSAWIKVYFDRITHA